MLARHLESRILELARPEVGSIPPPSQRAIARTVGVARGTVADRVRHGRKPVSKLETTRSDDEQPADGRRCPTCGALLTVVPCRACRLRLRRRRLFHVIESDEPLESQLEPAEVARVLDTLTDATPRAYRGRKRPDKPRPRVFRPRKFRFEIGPDRHVCYLDLVPPITVVR